MLRSNMHWFVWIVVCFISPLTCNRIPEDFKYKECGQDEEVCEYWLTVQEKLTMVIDGSLVYPHNGKLIKYDETPENFTTKINMDMVVTADGVHRMIIAVNETLPGPPIIAYDQQTIRVHVKNLLLSDSLTMHWHGQHQRGTPFMDGIGYVSQCPIAAGQSFTYEFKAEPKGTYWYHSHVGAQRSNGVYGALIIKERPKAGQPTPPTDVIMQIGDWHHTSSEEVYIKAVYGNYVGQKAYEDTKTVDGGMFSGVPWNSGLIEGKGRYIDPTTGTSNGAPLTWYNVKKNQKYRFRVIGVGSMYPIRVSVDNHTLSIVASDGYDLKPITAESFIINPGERFDFILETNQTVGNYWIRGESLEVGVSNHTVEAILSYEEAGNSTEPVSNRRQCTRAEPCVVVNCPFLLYHPYDKTEVICKLMSELENLIDEPAPVFTQRSEEHFLNFAFPGKDEPGAINGRKFEFPGVNSLFQSDEINHYDCSKHDCGIDKVCYCHYELEIPYDETVQMVWVNKGTGSGFGHPIHLHGHSFYVMKMEYAAQNETTGLLIGTKGERLGENPEIGCAAQTIGYCNQPKWQNESWANGNVPGINTKNPPRKDTLIIPTGGYAVIRIRTNNPGKWFMHCHVEEHMLDGMAMIIKEAVDRVPNPPKGFPICQNFYNDPSRDLSYIRANSVKTTSNTGLETCFETPTFIALAAVLGSLVVIQLIVIIVLCCKTKSNKFNTVHYNKNAQSISS